MSQSVVRVSAALLIFVATVVSLHILFEVRAVSFFTRSLETAGVYESVKVNEERYEVAAGQVIDAQGASVEGRAALPMLKLAYAKTLVRRNPIAALPGTDPESLRDAVNRLEDLQTELSTRQPTKDEEDAVMEALYPIDMLRAMATAEERRQAFLVEGTERAYRGSEEAQREALAAYERNLSAYMSAFRRIVPNTPRRFAAGEASFDYASVVDTIGKLERAVRMTQSRLVSRVLCVRGALYWCHPTEIAPIDVAPSIQAVERTDLTMTRRIVDALRRSGRSAADAQTRTYALPSSECIDETRTHALFKIHQIVPPASTVPYRRAAFVGDLSLINSADYASVPFYKFFLDRDVQYIPTDPFLHYVCIDFWTDLSGVLAMSAISSFASSTPLSAQMADASEARLLERRLMRSDEPVYQDDSLTYASMLGEIAKNGTLDSRYREDIENLLTAITFNAIEIDDAINDIVQKESGNLRILEHGVPVDLGAAYALFFRSALPFMFLANNPSVVGHDLVKITKLPPTERNPYVYFSKLATTPAMTERIIRDMTIYRDLHHQTSFGDLEAFFNTP